ncbi:MAG: hypothetical protein ACI9N1_002667 [Flavobacteriales bacterium]
MGFTTVNEIRMKLFSFFFSKPLAESKKGIIFALRF